MAPPSDFSLKKRHFILRRCRHRGEYKLDIFKDVSKKYKERFGCRRASIQEKAFWQREMFSMWMDNRGTISVCVRVCMCVCVGVP